MTCNLQENSAGENSVRENLGVDTVTGQTLKLNPAYLNLSGGSTIGYAIRYVGLAIKRFIAKKKSGTIEVDRVYADTVGVRKASQRCGRRY